MNFIGVPDLLTSGQTSRTISKVSQDLARVTQELSSGLQSNLVEASGGDPTRLYSIERELRMNEVRQFTVSQAQGRSSVTQAALTKVQNAVSDIGAPLLAAVSMNDQQSSQVIATGARNAFSETVAALNSRFGDRSLFAGAAVDGPALADPDVILAEIAAAVAGATTSTDVLSAIDTYFSDPTGFQTTGFLGSAENASDVELDDGEIVSFAVRADAPEIRDVLSALAIAVIGAEGGFAGDSPEARLVLLGEAGRQTISATGEIIARRGELGIVEERIDEAAVRIEAEDSLLQQARSSIMARDPFEAAIELSTIETQIQTIFSITGRLSALTLTNFIR